MSARAEPVAVRGARLRLRRAWAGFAGAVTFLTIVPVRAGVARQDRFELAAAGAWFPLVGAGVGAFAGALRIACQPLFGRGPGTVLALAGLVTITGALHEDALADTADGLGVRGDRARRLEVMRDSRSGAFGVLALVGWALLMFTSLVALAAGHALRALIVACAGARLAALLHCSGAPPARPDGLGAALEVKRRSLAIALLSAVAIMLAAGGPARGALSVAVCAAVSGLSAVLARRAIGGSTGDTIGAAVALTEAAICLALLASWR